jgi:dihydroxyacetone kinase
MSKHIDPYPAPKNRASAAVLALMGTLCFIGLFALAFLAVSCAPKTAATVNRDITTAIAGAGAAASQAEQEYQNKTIAQTPAARNTINNLGAAYEQARIAYLAVLDAEKIYQAAESAQLLSCSPSQTATSATNCQASTGSVAAAQARLSAAENDLNAKISNLSAQTKAVQSLK